jgi:hypothetical protein
MLILLQSWWRFVKPKERFQHLPPRFWFGP